jgi:hypothetical protein
MDGIVPQEAQRNVFYLDNLNFDWARTPTQRGLAEMIFGVVTFLFCWILFATISVFWLGLYDGLRFGIVFGFFFAMLASSFASLFRTRPGGLLFGGLFSLRYLFLRLSFWMGGSTPLFYVPFLNQMKEMLFMRQVGDGYIFTHRLLRDYFASLVGVGEGRSERIDTAAAKV